MSRVLVVDDESPNVSVVRRHLESLGHEVFDADSGEKAIELYPTVHPDLVLMDVMMSGMSGIQALGQLKQLAWPQFLPVVLVTALDDADTRRLALQAGADDFVTKPFDSTLLKLRVGNLLSQRTDRLALSLRNAKLAELERFRDEMTALLVHDLKNPVAIVLNNIDFAHEYAAERGDLVLTEVLDDALEGCRRLVRLIGNLLDIARADHEQIQLKRTTIAITDLVAPIIQLRVLSARHRGVELQTSLLPNLFAEVDPDLVTRMLENLLDNALHHTPPGGRIRVSAAADADRLLLRVANTGSDVPQAQRETIFDKYGQGASQTPNQLRKGLGLYFCRIAAEAHGGWIKLEQDDVFPVQFSISLPTRGAENDGPTPISTRSVI